MTSKIEKKKNYQIPSILVPSTRKILKYHNSDIIEIEAGGSTQTENVICPEQKFGFEEKVVNRSIVNIDYNKKWENRTTPKNEIDSNKGDEMANDIHTRLMKPGDSEKYYFDCPVKRVVIEVEDGELKDELGTSTNVFFLEFISSPSGGEVKETTEELYKEYSLQKQGFDLRNLLLRSITDEVKYFDPRKSEPNISWNGFDDVNMPFKPTMASTIYNNHLDKNISKVIKLKETSEDKLVIE